ncbi:MAG: carbohydrate kinase family protein [Ignavibacteriae bacterium]|nr:carbohydrate kinase family protein [Ignavibacteriota bacterium]
MTITVIGHLCLDVIDHPNGSETQSYGGIFFSVATLANLLSTSDTIYPVFGVGKKEYDAFIERLRIYPNIDTSGIYRFDAPTNQVRLVYTTSAKRIECSKFIADPIPMKKIEPYLNTDMVLVNMISGFDIRLETLDEIRMVVGEKHTPLYMDVHSLTLGVAEDFTRFHRPVDTWRRWLFMLHAAQMNEEEAAIVSPEKLDEQSLSNHTLTLHTNILIVTRGERGCTLFVAERKRAKRFDIPGISLRQQIDPTGCGDVFAAAYCARYMKTKNILNSAAYANNVAAFKAQLPGSTDIDKLSSFRLQEPTVEVNIS